MNACIYAQTCTIMQVWKSGDNFQELGVLSIMKVPKTKCRSRCLTAGAFTHTLCLCKFTHLLCVHKPLHECGGQRITFRDKFSLSPNGFSDRSLQAIRFGSKHLHSLSYPINHYHFHQLIIQDYYYMCEATCKKTFSINLFVMVRDWKCPKGN